MVNQLVIINNESVSNDNNIYFCDNIDMKSIPEGLAHNIEVSLILRKSNIKRTHQINLNKVKLASNIFTFLFNIFKTFKKKETNYLIISITPYTFFAYLLLFAFKKKIFLYLRSDGYEEYKAIFGFAGPLIYHVMFKIATYKSNIITCQERLFTKGKSYTVFPSELSPMWLTNVHNPALDKPKLLYVGRAKVEKGIFSLLKIFNEITINAELSIVGRVEEGLVPKNLMQNKKTTFLGHGFNGSKLINIYDNHNIFILPSFTEAHPKVIDESLARARPVIIFEEIEHIIQNRKGIFVSKREAKSLIETIEFIMKNYISIQDSIKKNQLPTKQKFISQMVNILS